MNWILSINLYLKYFFFFFFLRILRYYWGCNPCVPGLQFFFPAKEWDCVTAWKTGKALELSAPRLDLIAWVAMYLKCFPVPNATHSSSTFNNRDFKYNNVSVSSSYYYLLVVLFHTVCSMKKYSCVCLFVGAATNTVQVCFCVWWDHAVTTSEDKYFARNLSFFNFFAKKRKPVTLVLIIPQEAFPVGRQWCQR